MEIGGSAEVRYVQGDVDQVFVEGDAEVQRGASVDVRGSMLRIQSESGWKFWSSRRLQVQVTSRTLSRVSIHGAADFSATGAVQVPRLQVQISGAGLARFDNLATESLVFSVSGAGDGQVTGQTRDLSVSVSGKGEFRGENLQSLRARLSISGIGDVKVWALEDLNINVAGVGKVEYWGTPRVRQSTSGPTSVTARGAKPPLP